MNSIAFAFRVPARAVASVTILALIAWTLGLPAWIHKANAANVEDFSNTLSDSDLGAYSTSTISWTTENGMLTTQEFELQFLDPDANNSNFNIAAIERDDMSGTGTGGYTGALSFVASCGGVVNGTFAVTFPQTNRIAFESCGIIASSTTMAITIGGGGTADLILNPANEGSYVLRLTGTSTNPISDSGDTRMYIIDDVTVTATVETVFEFSINPVNFGDTVNGEVTTGTSTATSVPFGVIGVNTQYTVGQELRVDTNALNGFSVTVEADQTLTAGNGATIDTFENGSNEPTPTPWSGPDGGLGLVNEYGHWGLTTEDHEMTGYLDPFNDLGDHVGNFVDNPVEVFWHDAAVTNVGPSGEGRVKVAYSTQIMELQEAANDYTATLTYVATPLF